MNSPNGTNTGLYCFTTTITPPGRLLDNFSTIFDNDSFADRPRSRAQLLYLLQRGQTDAHVCQFAEDHVFTVQVRRRHCGDEELRPVGVGSCVGHREDPGNIVKRTELLVLELVPVDAVSSVPVPSLEVSSLSQCVRSQYRTLSVQT